MFKEGNQKNLLTNWNFEISSCEPMQITKYKKNGHYDFHQDGNGFTRFDNPKNNFLHGKTSSYIEIRFDCPSCGMYRRFHYLKL